MTRKAYLLVNFGGPRSLSELPSFLTALLTDRDLVRTNLPSFLHRFLFTRIARRRAQKVAAEYEEMGGGSPIFEDTEALRERLAPSLGGPLLTFHRYLESTHPAFIESVSKLDVDEIVALPLFPQFTYATTGSVARFFEERLPWEVARRLRWIRSYPDHPAFISPFVKRIRETLEREGLRAEECLFLFSAHGVPASFVASGDLYLDECRLSQRAVMEAFPGVPSLLSFQSQFGRLEWLRPYTKELVADARPWMGKQKTLLFLPISFTSDHVETIQEVGRGYLPEVLKQGIPAYRVPAIGLSPDWVEGCLELIRSSPLVNNQMLIRRLGCKSRCPTCRKRCRK